jgi:hypothetical protein
MNMSEQRYATFKNQLGNICLFDTAPNQGTIFIGKDFQANYLRDRLNSYESEITKLQSANAELLQQLEAEREEKGRLSQALSEIKEVTGGVKVSDYAYPIFSFVSDIYAILGELENESTSATEVVE